MRSLVIAGLLAAFFQSQAPTALRIVVLEGEDAVNIVQQKTAVRPLVEVRDRNNLPVAGATVTFTIGGGSPAAFAGGVQTLTVTTNAAGQAAAGGLNALSSGAFQIQVQAVYQGQLATAAISQTNFATAAAAAQAGSAASGAGGAGGGSATSAAGGAAGGGGGLSATTIGLVGAAVAGGAVAATQVGGGDEGDSSSETSRERRFTGPLTGQLVRTTLTTSQSGTTTCLSTRTVEAALTITLRDGSTTGRLETTGTQQEILVTGGSCSPAPNPNLPFVFNGEITGGPANLTYRFESTATSTSGAVVTAVVTTRFSGSLSGDTITGTFVIDEVTNGTNTFNGVPSTIRGSASASYPVTLR